MTKGKVHTHTGPFLTKGKVPDICFLPELSQLAMLGDLAKPELTHMLRHRATRPSLYVPMGLDAVILVLNLSLKRQMNRSPPLPAHDGMISAASVFTELDGPRARPQPVCSCPVPERTPVWQQWHLLQGSPGISCQARLGLQTLETELNALSPG